MPTRTTHPTQSPTSHRRGRRTGLTGVIGVGLLAAGLVGGGAAFASTAAAASSTTHERGDVLECHGRWKAYRVLVTVYENDVYGNHLQMVLRDGTKILGGGGETDRNLVRGDRVSASMPLEGEHRGRVRGDAVLQPGKEPVHEEFDDAGQHVVIDGWHKQRTTDLTFAYRGTAKPLTCETAFRYDLTTEKTDIE